MELLKNKKSEEGSSWTIKVIAVFIILFFLLFLAFSLSSGWANKTINILKEALR